MFFQSLEVNEKQNLNVFNWTVKCNCLILFVLLLLILFPVSAKATVVNIQYFPVQGPLWYGNDWLAPRPGHQHHGNDIFPLAGGRWAMYDYNYALHYAYAVESGYIAKMGTISGGGNRLWLKGDSGTAYYYAHLYGPSNNFAFVKQGERVESGQPIAYIGDTGAAQGGAWHLHFGVNAKGKPSYSESTAIEDGMVNPYPYLQQQGSARITGNNRYTTSIVFSNFGWPDGSDKVVLARGDNYVDVLSGSPLAAKLEAPLLYTYPNLLLPEIKDEIIRLGANTVYILGGTSTVHQQVEDDLVNMGLTVKRLAGALDRYGTSAKIGYEFQQPPCRAAILINGEDFESSLVVSNPASITKIPILLTRADELPNDIKNLIRKMSYRKIIIVGGESRVNTDIELWLKRRGIQVRRIKSANIDIYDLQKAVLNDSILDTSAKNIYVVQGNNYPNGLVAGPMIACKGGGTLLLSEPDKLNQGAKDYLLYNRGKVRDIYILGDEASMSESVRSEVVGLR